jgi:hypothetical protein
MIQHSHPVHAAQYIAQTAELSTTHSVRSHVHAARKKVVSLDAEFGKTWTLRGGEHMALPDTLADPTQDTGEAILQPLHVDQFYSLIPCRIVPL